MESIKSNLCAVITLPVIHDDLLLRVDELARSAFPRQSLIHPFDELEALLVSSALPLPIRPFPFSGRFFRRTQQLDVFSGGVGSRSGVVGRHDLLVRPHVDVVLQRGGRLDRRHDRDRHRAGVTVLVPDVAADVAAEVGTIRARRAAKPFQLLNTNIVNTIITIIYLFIINIVHKVVLFLFHFY